MTFNKFIETFGSLPFFDMPTVQQVSGEDDSMIRLQMHRWMKSGKILPLRRGMYTFSDMYRKTDLYPTVLANELYKPSYVSLLWVLQFYGLIPEKVVTYTSITSRVPRTFSNQFGDFQYSHVKQSCFFGFSACTIQNQTVWLADPEKALLDFWHLTAGEWTVERLAEMRFQNFEAVGYKKLERHASLYKSPRILRAVQNWNNFVEMEKEGEIQI